jgi:HJR/Mrr/RecB family endonuclease
MINNDLWPRPVQEVIAGMRFVDATHGAVVTNCSYTPSARALASKAGVLLLQPTHLLNLSLLIDGNGTLQR